MSIRLTHGGFYSHKDDTAQCQHCSWTYVGKQTSTTAAVRRHIVKTGHMVETIRTQRKLSGMYESGKGWVMPD